MAGVYDFDEDDIQPFPRKPSSKNGSHVSRSVKDAEQITACSKHQGKKIGEKKVDEKHGNQSSPQSIKSVLKYSKCKLPHGSTMTQSFQSSSKGEVMEKLVKIQGCCLEVLSVSPYAKEEKLSEVTVAGEGLLCAQGMIQMHSLEFTFTKDSITLKLLDDQNLTTIAWPLDEITGFSFRTCEQTNYNLLELKLTTSGMKLLEQKLAGLLCKSDFLCDKGSTLTTKIKSPYQSDQARKITSLCDCYKRLWKPGKIKRHDQMSLKQDPQERKGAEVLEGNLTAWFDLTYPKGDPDAVLVTMDDFLLLNPHEFVSDTIIDFYMKYLQSRLPEHEKKRCYFFNSFFFRKLAYLDRDIAYDLKKTNSLFEHMKRWTRDINIFTKDFLFVPIIQSCHWSLVIVCYPNHLFSDEHRKCYEETLILHFDSMEGFHKGVEEKIKKYLVQHWSYMFSTGRSRNDKSCNVKYLHAKVPQQTNYSDCGLFMLHYVEMFLTALQSGLSTILVSRNWFNPEDVASKRSMLQRLIKEMQEEETAGKFVLKHVDTPMHDTVIMEDVSVVLKKDLPEICFETGARYTQQTDHSCYSQTANRASHVPVHSKVAHAVGGSHLGKASDACRSGVAIRTFDMDEFKKSSNTLMESKHPSHLRTGKDRRQSTDICGGSNISREELDKMCEDSQSEGFATNAKQANSSEVDEKQVSCHTSPEEVDNDEGSYNLIYSEQGAAQGSSLSCLSVKEQRTLLQANNHVVSCDLDFKEDHTCPGVSSGATHLKENLMDKVDHTQDEEQGHSARKSNHHAHGPTSQSQQVYISSDEESVFVKVQKIVEASKLRQQRKAGSSKVVPAPGANNASKGIENQPPNSKWRLRRKSQFYFR